MSLTDERQSILVGCPSNLTNVGDIDLSAKFGIGDGKNSDMF